LYVPEFHEFLASVECPDSVKVAHGRVLKEARHEDGKTFAEPTAAVVNDNFTCDADEETRVLADAVRNLPYFVGDKELDDDDFDFGHEHDWAKTHVEVRFRLEMCPSRLSDVLQFSCASFRLKDHSLVHGLRT
jgi:hypothetical protein